jgi:hypothetical protein
MLSLTCFWRVFPFENQEPGKEIQFWVTRFLCEFCFGQFQMTKFLCGSLWYLCETLCSKKKYSYTESHGANAEFHREHPHKVHRWLSGVEASGVEASSIN